MKCLQPITIKNPHSAVVKYLKDETQYIQVPCGKCYACLANRRNDMIMRLRAEKMNSYSSFFITLTYDPEHLPRGNLPCKSHLDQFLNAFRMHHMRKYLALNPELDEKIFRKEIPQIRYFYVSEFGGKLGRVHYHLLLFNFLLGESYLRELLKKYWIHSASWQFDLADAVKPICNEVITYCCAYCLSSLSPDVPDGIRPLCNFSRNPGLGSAFLTDDMRRYLDSHPTGKVNCYGDTFRLPRYFTTRLSNQAQHSIKLARMADYEKYEKAIRNQCRNDDFRYFRYVDELSESYVRRARKIVKKQNFYYVDIQPDLCEAPPQECVSNAPH